MKYVPLSGSVKGGMAFGLAFASLLVTLAACGGSLVEPFPPSPAPPLTPPPISPSGYPTYVRVSPSFTGADQRYVFYDDASFGLQYGGLVGIEYRGSYGRFEETISLWFDANGGAWTATGTLRGDTLIIKYNDEMRWDDFEDGVYVLESNGSPQTSRRMMLSWDRRRHLVSSDPQ